MSRSDRSDVTKARLIVAGVVVAILIAASFIGWGRFQSAEYERQANNQTSEYARNTDQEKRQACFRSPAVDQQQCLAEASHEQRANERNERDLVAQKQSALWSYIMGAAAVFGVGLSVVGVVLVWTTFRETKSANEISRRGQRAWLQINIEIEKMSYGENQAALHYEATVHNLGNDVAQDVLFVVKMVAFGPHSDEEMVAFLNAPIDQSNWPPRMILPNSETSYKSVAHLARDQIGDTKDAKDRTVFNVVVGAKAFYRANADIEDGRTGQTFVPHPTTGAFPFIVNRHTPGTYIKQVPGAVQTAN